MPRRRARSVRNCRNPARPRPGPAWRRLSSPRHRSLSFFRMISRTPDDRRWQHALDEGRFGVWDLRPALDQVHYSPAWKRRIGLGGTDAPELTSFWRCRVHADDLHAMLDALRGHFDGSSDTYEMRFRLRSSGSGYHTVLSRGRAIERDASGQVLRMVGTMVKVSTRDFRAARGLPEPAVAPRPHADGPPPLHRLLFDATRPGRDALLGRIGDLLDAATLQAA